MKRSQIQTIPSYYETYTQAVEDEELMEVLQRYGHLMKGEEAELERVADHRYAEGKWTPKTVIQHLTDAERVFSYRALRFARADQTPLAGFDENKYAETGMVAHRTIANLLEEFHAQRQATIRLFQSFQPDLLSRTGMASGAEISVLALGFVIVGHQKHHARIIRERYF